MPTQIIQKWGNSHGVRIPKHILDSAHLQPGESVEITLSGNDIIIRKASPEKKTLRTLFAGFEGEYKEPETDWGAPAGEEIW